MTAKLTSAHSRNPEGGVHQHVFILGIDPQQCANNFLGINSDPAGGLVPTLKLNADAHFLPFQNNPLL
jgi:hypothetical protein